MLRISVATLAGLAFVLLYIAAAITVPDALPPQGWAVQALYWCVAGMLWVVPVWGLLIWAARGRSR